MKQGWRTCAIGRHLVDLPAEAATVETYKYNEVKIELLPEIKTQADFDHLISGRERQLRATRHTSKHEQDQERKFERKLWELRHQQEERAWRQIAVPVSEQERELEQKRELERQLHEFQRNTGDSMFIDRVTHANGSVTLISWNRPTGNILYRFDTYFRVGSKSVKYSGEVSPDRRATALALRQDLSREWREIASGELLAGIGFVADDVMLVDRDFNLESWELNIRLPDKPDVWLRLTAYAQESVGPGLRARAGGILPALLGAVAGVGQLRNRARPVGPIEADEILVAGTQDGKRTYGFKWEAPGKAYSLAEPNLNASLRVGESAYPTNKESFANDGEALELWDAVVDSIRLRPGAV